MSYLPSRKNISLPTGEILFQRDGSSRIVSLGYHDKFSWQPSFDTEPVLASNGSSRRQIDEIETNVSVAIRVTLKEMRADIMAMATQGQSAPYIQSAKTAATVEADDVMAGEWLDTKMLDITNVVVTAGGAELVSGVDYTVKAGAGAIWFLKAATNVVVTYDAPAIGESDARNVISVLQSKGVSGVFTIIGENARGKRYKLAGVAATLRPTSEIPFISDGSSPVVVELEGTGTPNESDPEAEWGRLIELA